MAEDKKEEVQLAVGDKQFQSVDELIESYQKLEKEKENLAKLYGRQTMELGGLRKQAKGSKAAPVIPEDKSDDFLERPGDYLEQLRQDLKAEILGEVKSAQKDDQYWSEFFKENPQLSPLKEQVITDAYNRLWPVLEGKNFDEQSKVIAKAWAAIPKPKGDDEEAVLTEAPGGLQRPAPSGADKGSKEETKTSSQLIQERYENLFK